MHRPGLGLRLLVTQRRHRADLDLVADGADADRWLDIAQAFAGPSGGDGPPRRTRAVTDVLRVGNCSGFYGDRLSAMREMLEGGELDVLTGDYLAELTMLILGRDQMKDPSLGYARTFLTQVTTPGARARPGRAGSSPTPAGSTPPVSPTGCRSWRRGQGLDPGRVRRRRQPHRPRRRARARRGQAADRERLPRRLRHRRGAGRAAPTSSSPAGSPTPPSSSARRSPASAGPATRTTSSPAPWSPGTSSSAAPRRPAATSAASAPCSSRPADRPLGFPLAEIAADGSCVITKHAGTGGLVSVDTVTAQLVYEIQSTRYLGPDVTTHLDTVELAARTARTGSRITGVRGEAPPPTAKVCLNELGGFRNQMELVLTGLDIDAKAAWVRAPGRGRLAPPAPPDRSTGPSPAPTTRTPTPRRPPAPAPGHRPDQPPDPPASRSPRPLVELALASYPGFTMTTPPAPATPYGVYRAGVRRRARCPHTVVHHDGTVRGDRRPRGIADAAVRRPRPTSRAARAYRGGPADVDHPRGCRSARSCMPGPATRAATPTSGSGSPRRTDAGRPRATWLRDSVTPEFVRALLPEAADLEVEVLRAAEPAAASTC